MANVMINIKCMFCHTTNVFGTTSIVYQGQQLKYCQNCEHQIIYQTLILNKVKLLKKQVIKK